MPVGLLVRAQSALGNFDPGAMQRVHTGGVFVHRGVAYGGSVTASSVK